MALIERLEYVSQRLRRIAAVDVAAHDRRDPVTPAVVAEAERRLGYALPHALRDVYIQEAGGARLLWHTAPDVFGEECKYGDLELIPPAELFDHAEGIWGLAEDAKREQDLDSEPGWAAIARDWPFWVPVFAFGNGDYFCLDVRKEATGEHPFVFLVHDTMWDEPTVHGQQVAPNLDELLARWHQVAFVQRFNWRDALQDDGINPQAPVFERLRAALME